MPGGGGTTAKFTQTGMVSFPSRLSSTTLRYWNTLLCWSETSGAIVAVCLVGVVGVDSGSSVSMFGAGVDCVNFFVWLAGCGFCHWFVDLWVAEIQCGGFGSWLNCFDLGGGCLWGTVCCVLPMS